VAKLLTSTVRPMTVRSRFVWMFLGIYVTDRIQKQLGCAGQVMGSIGHYLGCFSRALGVEINSERWPDSLLAAQPID
jgi:hypothetical protein